ncbi:MAG: hypothetical protein IT537_07290 [Hyphomicrobiales bacterium]|nr:hypothetical protein [Hyphomicrobiales bacterium]
MASVSFIAANRLVELLREADTDKNLYVRVLTSNRLALGADPLAPSAVLDLSKERVLPFSVSEQAGLTRTEPALADVNGGAGSEELSDWRPSRRGGEYWFELMGKRVQFYSLRDLLAGGLRALEESRPGTLEKLSLIKPRSRRIVAHHPKDLFEKERLAKEYAEKLSDGWYYGTNNSAHETNSWLERACSCAGLKWGTEFKTSLETSLSIDELADLLK